MVEISRKHNLISYKLTFCNSQNSTVMECVRSSVSLKQKKKRNIYLKVLWRAYLSDWLQPQHKVEKIWLNCLRRKAFNISPFSVMLALGFYTCPLSDWRRSLLLPICWGFLSLRYTEVGIRILWNMGNDFNLSCFFQTVWYFWCLGELIHFLHSKF